MEITIDNTHMNKETNEMITDYREINIMPGRFGFISKNDNAVLREWHNTTDPELHNPLMTPAIEAELLLIQAEFERLYDRAKGLFDVLGL